MFLSSYLHCSSRHFVSTFAYVQWKKFKHMQRKKRIMKPHLAITQLKQLTNSYLSTYFALCSPVDYFEASPKHHIISTTKISVYFSLLKRYCLKTLTVFCTSTCTGASDSDIHIPPVNYVLEKELPYIHSFYCILLQVKSLKVGLSKQTHKHTYTHPLLFISEVTEFLKDKNYLVMTTQ